MFGLLFYTDFDLFVCTQLIFWKKKKRNDLTLLTVIKPECECENTLKIFIELTKVTMLSFPWALSINLARATIHSVGKYGYIIFLSLISFLLFVKPKILQSQNK